MRYARYLRMERLIAASDAASITVRWRYGRRLLEDDTATTPAGHLRNGVLAGMTPRTEARILTAAPAGMSLAFALAGDAWLAGWLLVLAIASALVAVRPHSP